jgi:hypothetical protein
MRKVIVSALAAGAKPAAAAAKAAAAAIGVTSFNCTIKTSSPHLDVLSAHHLKSPGRPPSRWRSSSLSEHGERYQTPKLPETPAVKSRLPRRNLPQRGKGGWFGDHM